MGEYNQVVSVDEDKCIECHACEDECPMGCFAIGIGNDFGVCGACGACLEVCPVDAIMINDPVEAGLMTAAGEMGGA